VQPHPLRAGDALQLAAPRTGSAAGSEAEAPPGRSPAALLGVAATAHARGVRFLSDVGSRCNVTLRNGPAHCEAACGGERHDGEISRQAPPACDGAWGSNCQFFSKPPFKRGHRTSVDFLVYVEAMPAVAKQTFDKAAVFVADNSKPKASIGQSAYWAITQDEEPTIHILKGSIHFSPGIDPANDKERQRTTGSRNRAHERALTPPA